MPITVNTNGTDMYFAAEAQRIDAIKLELRETQNKLELYWRRQERLDASMEPLEAKEAELLRELRAAGMGGGPRIDCD